MVYVQGWDTRALTHLHTQDTTKVSNLLTLQSWLLQKQTFNQKQRPLQCSLETSGLHQQPLSPYTNQHWSTSCLKCVLVSASRHNYMKRCLDAVPWTVVWRVPQLRSLITFYFLCPQQHWLVESEQRRGLPVVACHQGIGSGGRVIEYWSPPSPADTEVMWILWLSTA